MSLMRQRKNRISKSEIDNCLIAVVHFPFDCGRNVRSNIRFEIDIHIGVESY